MKIAARALRGPLWLVWLSLVAAVHVAALETGLSPRPDADWGRAHADAGTAGHAVKSHTAASDDSSDSQDELPSNAALVPEAARTPPHGITHVTRGQSDRGDCGSPVARRSPRAPPIAVSL